MDIFFPRAIILFHHNRGHVYIASVYATYQVFKLSSRWTSSLPGSHSVQASPVPAVLVPVLRRAVVSLAAVAVYVAQVPAGAALERRRI